MVDVSQVDVLAKTFSSEEVTFTLKRMASARDKDNLIAHPLRAAVLIEFEEQLSEMILTGRLGQSGPAQTSTPDNLQSDTCVVSLSRLSVRDSSTLFGMFGSPGRCHHLPGQKPTNSRRMNLE